MFHFTKKRALVVGVVASLAIGGVAVAYFTNSGSGTTQATIGSSTAIAVTQSGPALADLFPAGPSRTVTVSITNPGAGAQYVTTVTLASISSGDAECDVSLNAPGSAFTMAAIPVAQTLAAGAATTRTGSLQMNDTGVSQDACQGEPLTLHFTSN